MPPRRYDQQDGEKEQSWSIWFKIFAVFQVLFYCAILFNCEKPLCYFEAPLLNQPKFMANLVDGMLGFFGIDLELFYVLAQLSLAVDVILLLMKLVIFLGNKARTIFKYFMLVIMAYGMFIIVYEIFFGPESFQNEKRTLTFVLREFLDRVYGVSKTSHPQIASSQNQLL